MNLESGVRADALAAAKAAEERYAAEGAAAAEGSGAAAARTAIPQRYVAPAGGAGVGAGEHAGEQLPAKLAGLCAALQAQAVLGLQAAQKLPPGSLSRLAQHEAYSVAVVGVQAALLATQKCVGRLEAAAQGRARLAAAPGPIGIAPGAHPSWSTGRLGALSLGDKGTATLPRAPKPRPVGEEKRPPAQLQTVAMPTGGAAPRKKKAAKGACVGLLRNEVIRRGN